MSLSVITELDEHRSGGHKMVLVECMCGYQFKIQRRRSKTQETCASCATEKHKNLPMVQMSRMRQENKALEKQLHDANNRVQREIVKNWQLRKLLKEASELAQELKESR